MNGKVYRVVWQDPQIKMKFDRYFNSENQALEYAHSLQWVYSCLGCDESEVEAMEIHIEEQLHDKTSYSNIK